MSTHWLSPCWKIEGLSPTQKIVLISLADQANDAGVCWALMSTMMRRTCLCERAVRKAVQELIELGYLERETRQGRSSVFTLTPACGAVDPDQTPARGAPTPARGAPTPARGAPITVINHKVTGEHTEQSQELPAEQDQSPANSRHKAKKPRADMTLTDYLGLCKETGQPGIKDTDPIFDWAEKVDLPSEHLSLAWQAFKARYADDPKRYKDWPAVFRRACKENWLKLWYSNGDGYQLTTTGHTARREHGL